MVSVIGSSSEGKISPSVVLSVSVDELSTSVVVCSMSAGLPPSAEAIMGVMQKSITQRITASIFFIFLSP